MMPNGGFFGMFWMWIIPIILIILAMVAIVVLFRIAGHRSSGPASTESPLDILKKRYARGEISREEFERMKKDLES